MKLLESTSLKGLTLKNRMVMAPMTRSRATFDGLVGEMQVKYYAQRASAGLIISEGINISAQGLGSPLTPGIWNDAQVEAWRPVTEAVHAAGGKIYAQLWHTGRVGHSVDKGGNLPVAPSAIGIQGQQHFTSQGPKEYETPHALTTEEVKQVVLDYGKAAENAQRAGFDGVELHGAFGYLPNQFLVDGANHRTDEYGGSVENRTRFVLEVVRAMRAVYTDGQVGVKLSPTIPYNNMIDSDPVKTFSYLITELDKLDIAYVHLMGSLFPIDAFPTWPKDTLEAFGGLFHGTVMVNGKYNRESAEAAVQSGKADLVSFGALYVANPDLAERFAVGAELNAPDHSTFYGGGAKGYIDYPALAEVAG
ncbi:MAG: alkene reductase [Bacteroidetes bacterium]|nr:alkene reductase [Bacteroidota bacterium]